LSDLIKSDIEVDIVPDREGSYAWVKHYTSLIESVLLSYKGPGVLIAIDSHWWHGPEPYKLYLVVTSKREEIRVGNSWAREGPDVDLMALKALVIDKLRQAADAWDRSLR
jgi:hypothetical protein